MWKCPRIKTFDCGNVTVLMQYPKLQIYFQCISVVFVGIEMFTDIVFCMFYTSSFNEVEKSMVGTTCKCHRKIRVPVSHWATIVDIS